jgi:hypothetical protein
VESAPVVYAKRRASLRVRNEYGSRGLGREEGEGGVKPVVKRLSLMERWQRGSERIERSIVVGGDGKELLFFHFDDAEDRPRSSVLSVWNLKLPYFRVVEVYPAMTVNIKKSEFCTDDD